MSIFRTIDGKTYQVATGQESKLVETLRQEMWTDLGSNKKYMERIGDMVAEMYDIAIDTENETAFLEALVKLEIIDRIK